MTEEIDAELERQIDAEYAGVCDKSKPMEEAIRHMIRMVELIKLRSDDQVRRMEVARFGRGFTEPTHPLITALSRT